MIWRETSILIEARMEPKKPSRRQIVFNWLMGKSKFATMPDDHRATSDVVASIDELLAALDSTNDAGSKPTDTAS